jgi:hypothetical protein
MKITFGSLFNRAGPALKTGQVGAEVVVKMAERRLDQSANAFGILRPSWKFKASVNHLKQWLAFYHMTASDGFR